MSDKKNNNEGFIPQHGGYRNLLGFQKAEIIYENQAYQCCPCQPGGTSNRL